MSGKAEVLRDAVSAAVRPMEDTGERMVPEFSERGTFWSHVYRYAFACGFVKGREVLDIACGEGYGSAALLRAGATRVTGIDVSEDACRHARRKYGIEARVGNAEAIPFPSASVDAVVSFETIEHVPDAARFLDECQRVLRPGGILVLSTPNKDVYSGYGRPINSFHCSEMTEHEFRLALTTRFHGVRLYSQHPRWAPWWNPRTLAADETPWNRWGFFRRVHRSARFRLAPICVYDPGPEQRSDAVREILGVEDRGWALLIPHAIRPRRRWNRELPYFFVATAVRGE
jgi:SAM-dependent methyltransferase